MVPSQTFNDQVFLQTGRTDASDYSFQGQSSFMYGKIRNLPQKQKSRYERYPQEKS